MSGILDLANLVWIIVYIYAANFFFQFCSSKHWIAHCCKDRCMRYNGGRLMLLKGKSLKSSNGKYCFTLQNDGNLVVYCSGKKLWNTETVSPDIYSLHFQSDGNLVLRKNDLSVAWASQTMDSSATLLLVHNDRNVVIYKNNHDAVWSTKTNGMCNKAGKYTDLLYLDIFFLFF